MDIVASRIFVYPILPLIIAIGQVGLDKSSRSRNERSRPSAISLVSVWRGERDWWLFRSLLHLRLGRRIHRLADRESLSA